MKSTRPWILYTVIRLGIFAVVLTALLLIGLEPWVSAIAAAVVGLCVTYIFFSRQREQVVTSFYEYRTAGPRDADADVEDELVEHDEDVVVTSATAPDAAADPASSPAAATDTSASEGEGRSESDTEEERRQAR
ncbi:DUF4229 domain-containing protein [Marisediminicola sp. LYQ134]|uniref:DUF4229 domain-containing protein n=1 Tax=unclassified Marisediminicola TaxID=2618316 RepID=UPI0039839E0C